MTPYRFRLPDIGEGTAEAECIAWHVEIGQRVEEDQPLLDVMTDKATVEVTSPVAGIVVERMGRVGDALPVGGVVLVLDLAGEEGAPAGSGDASRSASPPISVPAARSGQMSPIPAPEAAETPEALAEDIRPRRVLAAPALRRRAKSLGVDLAQVKRGGRAGRVRQADLDAYLAYRGPATSETRRTRFLAVPEATVVPIVGLRRHIAERLQDTKRRIPHFSYVEEVNVTQLEALRAALNDPKGGQRLTFLPFLIRAMVRALPDFPQLNARYDDEAGMLHMHGAVHVGIATQTETGLLVTVMRDAGSLDLWESASKLQRLSNRARTGKATPPELSGSTITITSLGAIGGIATTPVINSPEVAIVGVNKIVERPIVRDGHIEVAKIMNLSASFDHRIVDGWDAASFVQRVKSMLEMPAMLFAGGASTRRIATDDTIALGGGREE